MITPEKYDLIIVGGGPAGLSAAITAESEGLNTLVLDGGDQLGGQAVTSSLIENYPGSPATTGRDLMGRMIDQALSFNSEFLGPFDVVGIDRTDDGFEVHDGSDRFIGRSVLIASGVQYRRLVVPNIAAYLGRGVTYGSPNIKIDYSGKEIYVVGAANSSGQGAMHLSSFNNCKVNILVRGDGISDGMSEYLVERIKESPNIQVHTKTEVQGVDGDGCLKQITLKSENGTRTVPADELFIMIGAEPRTLWLPSSISRDSKGFVTTGSDSPAEANREFMEKVGRPQLGHETTTPGIFAAGDIRFGTTKRVASAVGDGQGAVAELHRYFAQRDHVSK